MSNDFNVARLGTEIRSKPGAARHERSQAIPAEIPADGRCRGNHRGVYGHLG
jgi:hypothetical protein